MQTAFKFLLIFAILYQRSQPHLLTYYSYLKIKSFNIRRITDNMAKPLNDNFSIDPYIKQYITSLYFSTFVLINIMNNEQTTSLTSANKYKVVLLGDSSVGKTSLVEKIIMNKFDEQQKPTVCLDTFKKNVLHSQKMVTLLFWDTAGQEKFNSIIPSAIRDYDCAILVYDLTNPATFAGCDRWLRMLDDACTKRNAPRILAANKSDLQRQIPQSEGFEWALKQKFSYLEVSAKNGDGVQNLVLEILEGIQICNKSQKSTNRSQNSFSVKIQVDDKKKVVSYREPSKNSCCSI